MKKCSQEKSESECVLKKNKMLQHMKDYGIWLMAVFARGIMVFMFNTGNK